MHMKAKVDGGKCSLPKTPVKVVRAGNGKIKPPPRPKR